MTSPLIADPDLHASASHRNMIDHLTAPLQAGAAESAITVSPIGMVELPTATREPLLLAAPLRALEGVAWAVTVELPGGSSTQLEFAAGTEAGAYLPLYRPPADPETGIVAPFSVRLRLVEVLASERRPVPAEQIASNLDVRLVEGVTGRMLYLLGAEKQRIRRQARELALVRTLAGAHGDALDRIGAELGVPRFFDTIRFRDPTDEERPSIFARFRFGERTFGPGRGGEITADARREPDEEYRRRLAIYKPWLYPSLGHVEATLNELLGEIGVSARALVTDESQPAAAAVHLVGVEARTARPGPPPALDLAGRAGFHEYARRTTLIWPGDEAVANGIHNARYLPSATTEQVNLLRRRLRAGYTFPAQAAIAPMLAQALDRVGRCRRALGEAGAWAVTRCQDATGGSRYELGLGADLTPPAAAELTRLANRLTAGEITLPTAPSDVEPDPAETAALLASARPRPPGEDPDGAWLLEACGLRTVHRVRTDLVYVSHIPTFGLAISGPSVTTVGTPITLEARYHATGEPGSHVLLVRGLQEAGREWTELGHGAWTVLEPAAGRDAWDAAVATGEATAAILSHVGLPVVTDPDDVAARLRGLPAELIATFRLPELESQRVTAGRPEAINDLRDLLNVLGGQGFSSALLLVVDTDEVVVVVGGIALPLAGLNLAERSATQFRWYAVRIWPNQGVSPAVSEIGYLGARSDFNPGRWGLYAIVALGQIRSQFGGTEAYEFTVDLPEGTVLSLLQYEYLMNLLAHLHPMGTRVNTWSIRQRHVDLDGGGTPEPVPPHISRTYRQYRRPRFRGATATGPNS
ncbi:MAG TPA: hypothetical protein VF062_12530 [Candidatus Limnocylindrales bacterium]